jgi:hypothetical protein
MARRADICLYLSAAAPPGGAMAGAAVSDIFREIEDELRRDNLLKLWARYGKYIIAAAVMALVVAGAIVGWRNHVAAERRARGLQYSEALALARGGKPDAAAKEFAALAQQGGGYGVPAEFERARLLAKGGDSTAAVALYDKIAATPGLDPDFRDLAVLLSVMHGMPEANAQAAVARLAPLTAKGNPFRPSALDLTATAKLEAGDRAGALAIYRQLADDLSAPQELRARAAELAAALAT